jgi:hypothetical protein
VKIYLGSALLALVVVGIFSVVPGFGFILGPAAALFGAVIGALLAARSTGRGSAGLGLKVGLCVGIGALVGSIIGFAVFGAAVGNMPDFQNQVIFNVQSETDTTVSSDMVTGVAMATFALVGFFMGLVDFVLALIGGGIAGALSKRSEPEVALSGN